MWDLDIALQIVQMLSTYQEGTKSEKSEDQKNPCDSWHHFAPHDGRAATEGLAMYATSGECRP